MPERQVLAWFVDFHHQAGLVRQLLSAPPCPRDAMRRARELVGSGVERPTYFEFWSVDSLSWALSGEAEGRWWIASCGQMERNAQGHEFFRPFGEGPRAVLNLGDRVVTGDGLIVWPSELAEAPCVVRVVDARAPITTTAGPTGEDWVCSVYSELHSRVLKTRHSRYPIAGHEVVESRFAAVTIHYVAPSMSAEQQSRCCIVQFTDAHWPTDFECLVEFPTRGTVLRFVESLARLGRSLRLLIPVEPVPTSKANGHGAMPQAVVAYHQLLEGVAAIVDSSAGLAFHV